MQEKDYILLLTKQFSGELTSAETDELQAWLVQSADHARLAAEFQQVWDKSAAYAPAFSPDLEADFRKVQARIQLAEVPRARVVPLGRRLLRAAAFIALLATAFWTYRSFVSPSVPQLTASAKAGIKREVALPDGTRVWLRQGSTLDFPQQFVDTERRVRLHGEAYFDVAHRDGQPFRVELPNRTFVEVLGTQFAIIQRDTQNTVLVRTGQVRFNTDEAGGNVILHPGEKATYNLPHNTLHKTQVATFNELAWQTGGLEFVKTPLSTVISDLEQYYNVKIVLRNPALHDCLHTAPLTNQPLEGVLQTLSLTYQLKVLHTTAGQYELVGGTCR